MPLHPPVHHPDSATNIRITDTRCDWSFL